MECYNNATQMYYYGARYGVYAERSRSNPRISIFVSVDPLAEKYPNKMPYHYVSNNPIMRIDPTGMEDGPGDEFKTLEEAAIDFGKEYNGKSIKEATEYSSNFYEVKKENGDSYFTYGEASIGGGGIATMPDEEVKEGYTLVPSLPHESFVW